MHLSPYCRTDPGRTGVIQVYGNINMMETIIIRVFNLKYFICPIMRVEKYVKRRVCSGKLYIKKWKCQH
uniref:Uncharacterized protein n=1 Tax=Lotus japonicus TaxID=34305 RepID=I3SCK0_LOTJA|nr:unknown [Lotus japonicus]